MKLNDLLKQERFKRVFNWSVNENIIITCSNIDDIFITLRELSILEIEIDLPTMLLISRFISANCGQTIYGSEALKIGQTNEYFGVKLILEK